MEQFRWLVLLNTLSGYLHCSIPASTTSSTRDSATSSSSALTGVSIRVSIRASTRVSIRPQVEFWLWQLLWLGSYFLEFFSFDFTIKWSTIIPVLIASASTTSSFSASTRTSKPTWRFNGVSATSFGLALTALSWSFAFLDFFDLSFNGFLCLSKDVSSCLLLASTRTYDLLPLKHLPSHTLQLMTSTPPALAQPIPPFLASPDQNALGTIICCHVELRFFFGSVFSFSTLVSITFSSSVFSIFPMPEIHRFPLLYICTFLQHRFRPWLFHFEFWLLFRQLFLFLQFLLP